MITLPVHVYTQSLSIISQAPGALRTCCPAVVSVVSKQAMYWLWLAVFSKVSHPAAAQACKHCVRLGCPVAQMASVLKARMYARQCAFNDHAVLHVPYDKQHCFKGIVYRAKEAHSICSVHSHVQLIMQ